MGKFIGAVLGVIEIGIGFALHLPWLVKAGIMTVISGLASALLAPGAKQAQATGAQVQVGEVSRRGIFGEGATAGSLVDAFNYGGKYGTDWTVLVIALADHECEALVGFYVYNTFVPFTGDGYPDHYNNQLLVHWRPGTWDDNIPPYILDNCPTYPAGDPLAGQKTWTSADIGRSVAKVYVAYKADDPSAKHPVWTAGQPTFQWVVKGLKCYSARDDDTVGGAGSHRWDDDTTRVWSDNPVDCRYTWARGIYAPGHVDEPAFLLLGRGLSAEEAPPANVFAPANTCDEDVALKQVLTSLSVDAHVGNTMITLGLVTGIGAGTSLLIDQPGFLETVTVESVSGLVVTLTGGLAHDHPATTPVSWSVAKGGGVTEKRYRIGGAFGGDDAYIDTETAIAAACGGIIVEREGSVEMIPGRAETPAWAITDDDLVTGTQVTAREFRSVTDQEWVNMVAPAYIEPGQKWAYHTAPLRRDNDDVIADGEPRVAQPQLALVTSGTQAQRLGEQMRRKGRLWRTRGLTLPPRFIGAEHGDWLVWQSKRYGPHPTPDTSTIELEDGSGGIALEDGSGRIGTEAPPLVFRIVSDGQGPEWRNELTLEEISADVFAWNSATDELADTSVAVDNPKRPAIGAPDGANWTLAASDETGSGGDVLALKFTGSNADDPAASSVIFEFAVGSATPGPDDDSVWSSGAQRAGSTVSGDTFVAGVLPGTEYWGAVSYLVSGVRGDRLVLGPVTTATGGATEGRVETETGGRVLGEGGEQIIKE